MFLNIFIFTFSIILHRCQGDSGYWLASFQAWKHREFQARYVFYCLNLVPISLCLSDQPLLLYIVPVERLHVVYAPLPPPLTPNIPTPNLDCITLFCLMVKLVVASLFEGLERNSLKSWLTSASASTEEPCNNNYVAKESSNLGNWAVSF